MSSLFAFIAASLLACIPCHPSASAVPMSMTASAAAHFPSLQDPEDPNRVLGLLNGLIERVQESSPVLAAILKFLAFLVYLVLNIKTWGPPALVVMVVVVGLLVWQGRRHKRFPPSALEREEEAEL